MLEYATEHVWECSECDDAWFLILKSVINEVEIESYKSGKFRGIYSYFKGTKEMKFGEHTLNMNSFPCQMFSVVVRTDVKLSNISGL